MRHSGHTPWLIMASLETGLPFLQKPFTPAALALKVREVLDASAKANVTPRPPECPGSRQPVPPGKPAG